MGLSLETVSELFGNAVLSRDWAAARALFCPASRKRISDAELALAFGWENLAPQLKESWAEQTGEDEEDIPELDPPTRFEASELDGRDEYGPEPVVEGGILPEEPARAQCTWVQIDFLPQEDSEFDVCYRCNLAMSEEDPAQIAGFSIEVILD